MPRVRYLRKNERDAKLLHSFPSFHASGNVKGMKDKYYGKDALLVRSGSYIYNVSTCPEIYENAH